MLMKYRDAREEEGFTLIELLVVIIIIGILAAIAIPTFLGQRDRARRGAMQSDLRNIAIEYETYYTDYGTYDGYDESSYNASDNVTITASSESAREFCIYATHSAFTDEVWYFDSDAATQLNTAGSC